MDDSQILSLLFARAESAIDALSRKFGPRLLATARNILDSPEDAEESVSDTYLALWNAIPPRQPDPLAGFVFKTGRNQALKKLRQRSAEKRDSRYDLSLDELSPCLPGGSLEEQMDARLLGQAIDRFLDTLPKENRNLFLRRYWFGDSVKSLSAAFSLSGNVISVRLSRIRAQLKAYLIQEGFFDESR